MIGQIKSACISNTTTTTTTIRIWSNRMDLFCCCYWFESVCVCVCCVIGRSSERVLRARFNQKSCCCFDKQPRATATAFAIATIQWEFAFNFPVGSNARPLEFMQTYIFLMKFYCNSHNFAILWFSYFKILQSNAFNDCATTTTTTSPIIINYCYGSVTYINSRNLSYYTSILIELQLIRENFLNILATLHNVSYFDIVVVVVVQYCQNVDNNIIKQQQ